MNGHSGAIPGADACEDLVATSGFDGCTHVWRPSVSGARFRRVQPEVVPCSMSGVDEEEAPAGPGNDVKEMVPQSTLLAICGCHCRLCWHLSVLPWREGAAAGPAYMTAAVCDHSANPGHRHKLGQLSHSASNSSGLCCMTLCAALTGGPAGGPGGGGRTAAAAHGGAGGDADRAAGWRAAARRRGARRRAREQVRVLRRHRPRPPRPGHRLQRPPGMFAHISNLKLQPQYSVLQSPCGGIRARGPR